MNQAMVDNATTRFNNWKTGLSNYTITNFVLTPGYGIGWTQTDKGTGVSENRSARISEIENKDQDYMDTWNKLANQASSTSGSNMEGASSSWLKPVLIIAGLFFIGRWVYSRFVKKSRKRR